MPALAASNPQIRRLRRLLGRRSARSADGAMVFEGPTLVAEAIATGAGVESVFVDDDHIDDDGILDLAGRAGVEVQRVAPGVLGSISDVVTPRPVLAIVAIPLARLDEVVARSRSQARHLVVLVEVRDPGNVGTIIRAAEASGAAGVICTTGTVDPWSPKVARSSSGAVLHLPVVTGVEAADAVAELGDAAVPTLGTVLADAPAFDQVDLSGTVALFLGNEAHGLDPALSGSLHGAITIPMEGRTESLNVAMAASILCFEALAQRRRGVYHSTSEPGPEESDWTAAEGDDKVIGR